MVAQSINSPFEGRFVERPLSVRFRRAGDVDLWDIGVAHCQELERWRSKIFADLYDRGGRVKSMTRTGSVFRLQASDEQKRLA